MIKTPLSTMMGDGSNMNGQSKDELEFADFAAFPASGEASKLYIALDENRIYRWTGSTYVEITASVASTVDISLGGTGATTAEQARTNLGLGTAATVNISTSNLPNWGQALKKGDFGLGSQTGGWADRPSMDSPQLSLEENKNLPTGFYTKNGSYTLHIKLPPLGLFARLIIPSGANNDVPQPTIVVQTSGAFLTYTLWSSSNTTVDSNGFIKKASPIVQLFADKIELNDEAQQQNIEFEKLGVGDYLINGSSGFAQDGWYIETPKDANGNVLFSVVYENLENGDISVKTYKKKFDLETASIVADLTQPFDITAGRWIDLRLQELPQPEIEVTDATE